MSACNSSNEEANNFDSNILVDGIEFIPSKAFVTNATVNVPGESAKHFVLSKGSEGTSTYELINFAINYPQTSSSVPNGDYDFGIGTIGAVLFA